MRFPYPRNIFGDHDGLFLGPSLHLGGFFLQLLGCQLLCCHGSQHRRGKGAVKQTGSKVLVDLDVIAQCPHLTAIGS